MKKIHTFEDTLETLLFDAGLSEKESRVYRVLLEKGTLPVPEIVKLSGLKKGITYTILYKLTHEELLTQYEKAGKLYFQVNPPEMLKTLVERKKKTMEDVAERVDKIIPQLQSQYKLAVGKPTIQYFEGEEGIKAVFEDIYGAKEKDKNVWGCVDLEKADEVFPAYITSRLIPKRIRNKLHAYAVIADSPQARDVAKKDRQQLRDSILVNKTKFPLPAEIEVYEDKVALLSFEKNEFIGILVTNQAFADSLRSLFQLAMLHKKSE